MSDVAAPAWPLPRAGSGSPAGTTAAALVCALAAACAFAVAGVAWSRGAPERPAAAAPAVIAAMSAPPRWLDILKPVQIFSLEAAQFRQASLAYAARRLVSGGAREDTLGYGPLPGEAPMLQLAVLRGEMPDAHPGIADGLTRLAARQGLAATLGTRRGTLTTRFGRAETATLRLPGRTSLCDGFHLARVEPALAIDGIACGLARGDLACLIDRLDLASAGEDSALADVFAAAELRRNPSCRGMRLGPDGAHAAWLDDKRVTLLRKMRR